MPIITTPPHMSRAAAAPPHRNQTIDVCSQLFVINHETCAARGWFYVRAPRLLHVLHHTCDFILPVAPLVLNPLYLTHSLLQAPHRAWPINVKA